jgi:hypothetical protein
MRLVRSKQGPAKASGAQAHQGRGKAAKPGSASKHKQTEAKGQKNGKKEASGKNAPVVQLKLDAGDGMKRWFE